MFETQWVILSDPVGGVAGNNQWVFWKRDSEKWAHPKSTELYLEVEHRCLFKATCPHHTMGKRHINHFLLVSLNNTHLGWVQWNYMGNIFKIDPCKTFSPHPPALPFWQTLHGGNLCILQELPGLSNPPTSLQPDLCSVKIHWARVLYYTQLLERNIFGSHILIPCWHTLMELIFNNTHLT